MHRGSLLPANQLHEIRHFHRGRLDVIHRENDIPRQNTRRLRRGSLVHLTHSNHHCVHFLPESCPDSVIFSGHAHLGLLILLRRIIHRVFISNALQKSGIDTILKFLPLHIIIIIQVYVGGKLTDLGHGIHIYDRLFPRGIARDPNPAPRDRTDQKNSRYSKEKCREHSNQGANPDS